MAYDPSKPSLFESKITLGNVLTIGAMIVSVSLAWANMDGRVRSVETEQAKHDVRIGANDSRIRSLDTTIARQDEKLNQILETMRKLEASIDRAQAPSLR